MGVHFQTSSTWRQAKTVTVNDGGTWRQAKGVWRNTSGTWRAAWVRNSAMGVVTLGQFTGASPGTFGTIDGAVDLRGFTLTSFYYDSVAGETQFNLLASEASFAGWTNASYAKDVVLVATGSPSLFTDATFIFFPNGSNSVGRFVWAGDVFSLVALAGTTVYVQARAL